MPGTTPTYALPYDSLTDPPDGADMGEDLAVAVEAQLVRIDAALPLTLSLSRIAHVSVVCNSGPAAGPFCETISWGKTLPGTVRAFACGVTDHPGDALLEVAVSNITSTGCQVCAYGGIFTVYVLGVGI